jgi:hypothetical protein
MTFFLLDQFRKLVFALKLCFFVHAYDTKKKKDFFGNFLVRRDETEGS